MRFPVVTGSNLLRRKISLPGDLQGEMMILFIAFQQWHQAQVDSWVPRAGQLEQAYPGVQFYELPVIQHMNILAQTFINEGMRAGIPSQDTRQKTVTLYLDKASFRHALGIPHEDTIWVLLLNRQGDVVWRTDGAYTQEKDDHLTQAIQDLARLIQPAS